MTDSVKEAVEALRVALEKNRGFQPVIDAVADLLLAQYECKSRETRSDAAAIVDRPRCEHGRTGPFCPHCMRDAHRPTPTDTGESDDGDKNAQGEADLGRLQVGPWVAPPVVSNVGTELTAAELAELRAFDSRFRREHNPVISAVGKFLKQCGGRFDFDEHHETRATLELYRAAAANASPPPVETREPASEQLVARVRQLRGALRSIAVLCEDEGGGNFANAVSAKARGALRNAAAYGGHTVKLPPPPSQGSEVRRPSVGDMVEVLMMGRWSSAVVEEVYHNSMVVSVGQMRPTIKFKADDLTSDHWRFPPPSQGSESSAEHIAKAHNAALDAKDAEIARLKAQISETESRLKMFRGVVQDVARSSNPEVAFNLGALAKAALDMESSIPGVTKGVRG